MLHVIAVRLGRLSVGSAKPAPKSGFDDLLLFSNEGGKNDYDWYSLHSRALSFFLFGLIYTLL